MDVKKIECMSQKLLQRFSTFQLFLCFLPLRAPGPLHILQEITHDAMTQQLVTTPRRSDTYRNQLKDYSEVEATYNEMVGTFLTDTELSYLNRSAIIDMIKDDVMNYVDVKSWNISNNTIRITTGNTTMDTVSKIVNVLNTDSRNSYVNVTTTKAEKDSNDYVVANIVVTYSGAGE